MTDHDLVRVALLIGLLSGLALYAMTLLRFVRRQAAKLRLECLRLAIALNRADPVEEAARMVSFVQEGFPATHVRPRSPEAVDAR